MILYDWAEKYGDIMKISLFNTTMVVVNSTELAYKVLVKSGKGNFISYVFMYVYAIIRGLDLHRLIIKTLV